MTDTPTKGHRKRSSDVCQTSDRVKRSSSISEDRARDVVAGVRGNLLEFFEDNNEVVVQGARVAKDLPTAVWFDVDQNTKAISTVYPEFDKRLAFNVAAGLSKTGQDYKEGVVRQIDSSTLSFKVSHTYQAKGKCAKASEVDRTLPQPLDSGEACMLWGGECSWNSCMQLKSVEDAMQTLQPLISACKKCFFDYKVVATRRSVVGTLKPDVVIKLKGSPVVDHSSVGGILSLHSLGEGSTFDNDFSVGQLITYGQEFLNNIPERLSVVLGITDLQHICWFRLTRCGIDDADVALGGFKVGRSHVTSAVKESIGGFLRAEPASLGIQMKWKTDLRKGWTITGYLGSGRTSNIYKVDCGDGKECALKILKSEYEDHAEDIRYLDELQAVDGVPRVLECLDMSMLAVEPVGVPFEGSRIGEPDLQLAGLVDVLQSAHALNIVHRDIRRENLMIAESLQQMGGLRFFIIDWGFAKKIDCKCGNFRGSITTASNNVLSQYMGDTRYLKYTAADDLVSLVRCIFLALNPVAESKLDKIRKDTPAILKFWSDVDRNQMWKVAQEAAAKADYDTLKTAFKDIEQLVTSIAH